MVDRRSWTTTCDFFSPMSTPYPTRVNVSFFSAPWFPSSSPTGGSGAGSMSGHFVEAGASSTTTP